MNQKVKIIKASLALQAKAGTGEVDEKKVQKAEQIIEQNTEDFQPIAQSFLDRLALGVANARNGMAEDNNMKLLIAGMTQPVMELKANARMFKYDLVTALANIMLGFLENIQKLDKDAIDIVEAHHKTLSAIVIKKMTGDGGAHGQLFQTELNDACQRYFHRRK